MMIQGVGESLHRRGSNAPTGCPWLPLAIIGYRKHLLAPTGI